MLADTDEGTAGAGTGASLQKQEKRLTDSFFDVTCIELAKNLLGTILVRRLRDGTVLKGKIVETECYLGAEDKASHSYKGKMTPRNEAMFMKPGTIYVYQTYGMYYCMNISSQGDGAAVLLRSIEPLAGLEQMAVNRQSHPARRKVSETQSRRGFKSHELCNGPSKLCISFDIDNVNYNKKDITICPDLWLEKRMENISEADIVRSTRIGIDSAGLEWASKLLRFYIYDNQHVSIRDRKRKKLKENNIQGE